ncbi:hypothetical protein B0H13DRAFT_2143402 [Mycena leptocephala]|nr:hypothetical protein B0H13DRAFT_2143402 [Mycena leptocephala]
MDVGAKEEEMCMVEADAVEVKIEGSKDVVNAPGSDEDVTTSRAELDASDEYARTPSASPSMSTLASTSIPSKCRRPYSPPRCWGTTGGNTTSSNARTTHPCCCCCSCSPFPSPSLFPGVLPRYRISFPGCADSGCPYSFPPESAAAVATAGTAGGADVPKARALRPSAAERMQDDGELRDEVPLRERWSERGSRQKSSQHVEEEEASGDAEKIERGRRMKVTRGWNKGWRSMKEMRGKRRDERTGKRDGGRGGWG